MNKIDKFKNKKVLIWGYGREGKSTENFLKRYAEVQSIKIFEGKPEDFCDTESDIVFKSPGIPYEKEDERFTSQTELFLELFRNQTIGVTGTKGKSTTTSMIYHVLKECSGRPVFLVGNIGVPCLDIYEEMTEDSIVAFEMSCHQLARTKISPHVAVFLNLFQEHLDYYKTLDKYFEAKSHIASYQKENDFFYKGENVPEILTPASVNVLKQEDVLDFDLKTLGKHNQFNATVAYQIATEIYGCDPFKVKKSMETFEGLSHRLEYFGTFDGVKFYDDSISTIPEAAISSLESVKDADTILIGGMDRGISYVKLVDYIREHPEYHYIFMYATGKRIFEEVRELPSCTLTENLQEATREAFRKTEKGKSCILSPAAPSYGDFKNFEERGDAFKELVKSSFEN